MTPKQKEELRMLIDNSYGLDFNIKTMTAVLDANKKRIKELTAKSKLKIHRGVKARVKISHKNYGCIENPSKVWTVCKGDKKLFFSLIKVLVGKVQETFDESVVEKLVTYKEVTSLSFKK